VRWPKQKSPDPGGRGFCSKQGHLLRGRWCQLPQMRTERRCEWQAREHRLAPANRCRQQGGPVQPRWPQGARREGRRGEGQRRLRLTGAGGGSGRPYATTALRCLAEGPNIPWECTRCLPRGGVTAANFLSSCKGVITNTSRPRPAASFGTKASRPPASESRDAASGPLAPYLARRPSALHVIRVHGGVGVERDAFGHRHPPVVRPHFSLDLRATFVTRRAS